ncbi:DUF3055 family protein [Brevibacillus centrosporus]|uniref:SAV0927 family protein n=1 Tax=Brevibacillus centrosporus TaxID=54910 RepID=UPI000F0A3CC2|nr:SAV0927 family protein [Brevibacillus centrosporus]MEC2132825.1 DUF3055 family protein [Brevibacillus centrosporus]RNB64300.1 DUF3055 family protein [Brevibacillus centrosporus]GED32215.1 hypothetical protein BCE02nite_33560 [Brevibacillus centrosporus]
MSFDYLYDQSETMLSRYVAFTTDNNRYDLGLFYSQHFDGKSFVLSLQNMQSVLISSDEIAFENGWVDKLAIRAEDVEVVSSFLKKTLSSLFHNHDLD